MEHYNASVLPKCVFLRVSASCSLLDFPLFIAGLPPLHCWSFRFTLQTMQQDTLIASLNFNYFHKVLICLKEQRCEIKNIRRALNGYRSCVCCQSMPSTQNERHFFFFAITTFFSFTELAIIKKRKILADCTG